MNRTLLAVSTLLALAPGSLHSQTAAATDYQSFFQSISSLAADPSRVAPVQSPIVLDRGPATLRFESGAFYALQPVGGRMIGLAFIGNGRFTFAPPESIERAQLAREYETEQYVEDIRSAVILFADSTFEEISRSATFQSASVPDEVARRIRRTVQFLGDEDSQTLDPDLMRTFINDASNNLFYAHMKMARGPDLVMTVNPWEVERYSLSRAGRSHSLSVLSLSRGSATGPAPQGNRFGDAVVTDYDLEVWLPRTSGGSLHFNARADMHVLAEQDIGPWMPFSLHSSLEVDSAFWGDGSIATTFKGEDSWILWLRAGARLAVGDTQTVRLYYHGDFIERFGDLFFIPSASAWYPRPMDPFNTAQFDIVYHTPTSYEFASAGQLINSREEGDTRISHWRSVGLTRNVGFNIGLFEPFEANDGDGPAVTVLYADEAHRGFRGVIPQGRNMKQQVGTDVTNALRFFTATFGSTGLDRFYATEIPYPHGEAFAGLVHLAVNTFINTSGDGFDEWFRAHEVAHQWWGIGVDMETYHDHWLSEGFASFAALWYLQVVRGENDRYFGMLRDWRRDIMATRGNPDDIEDGWGPIALGYRVRSDDFPQAVNTVVYEKGAWVLHMLRTMMLDLRTMNEDAFTNMMRDFFTSYNGTRATTADFQRTVERHIGMPMDWFFEQWVRGNYIPKYRVTWETEPEGDKFRLILRVRQERVAPDFRSFPIMTVDFGENRQARFRVEVTGAEAEIPMPLMPLGVTDVRFNELQSVLAEVDVDYVGDRRR